MDDPARMRLGDGLAGLDQQRAGERDGERPALVEANLEVGPFEQLHRQVRLAARRAPHVEDANHVRALEHGGDPRLPLEPRPRLVVMAGVDAEDLQRHPPAHADVPRRHDRPHAAGRHHPFDLVARVDQLAGDETERGQTARGGFARVSLGGEGPGELEVLVEETGKGVTVVHTR